MDRTIRQIRAATSEFVTREDNEDLRIEGYFAVFNSNYEIWDDYSESIAPGAFTDTLAGDIRALIDHDTRLVLGRTTNRTLELRQDERGLWGSILINPNDQEAMNLYARVKRGDVSQCSIGFNIEQETYEENKGKVQWTITRVKLFEVSCCTFPAYEETNITARKHDAEEILKRKAEGWRIRQKKRLEEIKNGTESTDDQEKD